jgi:hypothetical protein
MKIKILFVLLFTTTMSYSQTKLIAHKSHSGSNRSFANAYQKNKFGMNFSNFGLPGNKNIYILDTIIALNKSTTVMKLRVSNVCYRIQTNYKDLKKSDFKSISDTLINDKVFNKKNKISYIKLVGSDSYKIRFANTIEEVVFIGFKK